MLPDDISFLASDIPNWDPMSDPNGMKAEPNAIRRFLRHTIMHTYLPTSYLDTPPSTNLPVELPCSFFKNHAQLLTLTL